MKWRNLRAGLLSAGALALVLTGCGTSSSNGGSNTTGTSASKQIVIGFANPLTGSQAGYGQSNLQGIKLAAAQVNAAGGVLGKKIVIKQYDTKADPATGIAGAHEFANSHVNAVVGFFDSDISIPAAGVLSAAGVPMVSAASTSPKLTQLGYKNVFRVCGTDNLQGKVEADFAVHVLHAKTAVVLNDMETYGQGVSQFFSQNFTALGGRILDSEGVPANQSDFSSVLTKIKSLNPDVIQFGGFYQAAGLMIKQARGLGITAKFITDDGVIGPQYTQIGGQYTAGSYVSSEPAPQDEASAASFVKQFVKKYHTQPGEFAGYSYDALMVIVHAIKAEGSASNRAIIKGLAATKNYQGVTGPVTFNSVGNNITPSYFMYQVQPTTLAYKVVYNPNTK